MVSNKQKGCCKIPAPAPWPEKMPIATNSRSDCRQLNATTSISLSIDWQNHIFMLALASIARLFKSYMCRLYKYVHMSM